MPHNKTLYQHPGFWAALVIPLGVALLISLFIGWHSFYVEGVDACWSAACINDALYMLKLPIGIAALVFPCVALVASHHSSAQSRAQLEKTDEVLKLADSQIKNTLKQIEIAIEKNNYDKLLSHQEFIFRNIKAIENEINVRVYSYNNVYRKIFPENSIVSFSPWSDDMEIYDYGKRYDNFLDYVFSMDDEIFKSLCDGDIENAEKLTCRLFEVFGFNVINGYSYENRHELMGFMEMDGEIYKHAVISFYFSMQEFYVQLFDVCYSKGKLDDFEMKIDKRDYSLLEKNNKKRILERYRVQSDGTVKKVLLSSEPKKGFPLAKMFRWLESMEHLKVEKKR